MVWREHISHILHVEVRGQLVGVASLSLLPFLVFEIGFLSVALAVVELLLWTRLASNLEICLPSAGI